MQRKNASLLEDRRRDNGKGEIGRQTDKQTNKNIGSFQLWTKEGSFIPQLRKEGNKEVVKNPETGDECIPVRERGVISPKRERSLVKVKWLHSRQVRHERSKVRIWSIRDKGVHPRL